MLEAVYGIHNARSLHTAHTHTQSTRPDHHRLRVGPIDKGAPRAVQRHGDHCSLCQCEERRRVCALAEAEVGHAAIAAAHHNLSEQSAARRYYMHAVGAAAIQTPVCVRFDTVGDSGVGHLRSVPTVCAVGGVARAVPSARAGVPSVANAQCILLGCKRPRTA